MKSHFCLLLLYFGLEMFPERAMGWRLSPYTVVPLGSCGTLTMWDPEDKISSLKICPLRVCWNPSPLLYTTLFPGCMNSINFSAIHSSLRYGTLPWPQMHQGETTLHWNIWNCESNTPFLLISYCVSGIFIGTRSQLTHFQAPEGEQQYSNIVWNHWGAGLSYLSVLISLLEISSTKMTAKLHSYFHIPVNDSANMKALWMLHNTVSYNPVGSNTSFVLLNRVSKISPQFGLVKNRLTVKISVIWEMYNTYQDSKKWHQFRLKSARKHYHF